MDLAEEAIKEYQDIYLKLHGTPISADEARIQGLQLIILVNKMLKGEKI